MAAGRGTEVRRGTETKTHHCQPLRHRNRHPPRETLNHFYCIELSLLPAERTSKRAFSLSSSFSPSYPSYLSLSLSFSLSLFLSPLLLSRLSPGHSQPFVLRPHLPAGYALFLFLSPAYPSPTAGPGDNTNAKAFTPLWLPKWNKFFNSRIYRRANESPALSLR